jgi:hypothetical protein
MRVKKKSNFIIGILVSVVYLVYRTSNVFIVKPFFDDFDSPAYFDFQLYPSFRTHGITAVFATIQNEFLIALFQAVIGSMVWIYLWIVIMEKINSNILNALFTISSFIFASSSIIVEHDSVMLSESLSISSTILLFATTIKIIGASQQISSKTFYAWAFAYVWFFSTKTPNSVLMPLIIAPLIYIFFVNYKFIRMKFIAIITLGLSIFSFVSSLSSDVSKTLNTAGTIHNRLWLDDRWRDELLLSGYPKFSHEIWLEHGRSDLGVPPDQAVVNLPEYKKWWADEGENFLIKFTLTNPDYAVFGPVALPFLNPTFSYKQTLLSGWSQGTDMTFELPGFKNSVLQRTIFWPDEPEKAYLALSLGFIAIGLSLFVLVKYNNRSVFYLIILSLFYIFLWSYFNWWFGSKPVDMTRHNLAAAIMFRLLAIFSIFYTIDLVIRQKKRILIR